MDLDDYVIIQAAPISATPLIAEFIAPNNPPVVTNLARGAHSEVSSCKPTRSRSSISDVAFKALLYPTFRLYSVSFNTQLSQSALKLEQIIA